MSLTPPHDGLRLCLQDGAKCDTTHHQSRMSNVRVYVYYVIYIWYVCSCSTLSLSCIFWRESRSLWPEGLISYMPYFHAVCKHATQILYILTYSSIDLTLSGMRYILSTHTWPDYIFLAFYIQNIDLYLDVFYLGCI